jgi:hypothetical protein
VYYGGGHIKKIWLQPLRKLAKKLTYQKKTYLPKRKVIDRMQMKE